MTQLGVVWCGLTTAPHFFIHNKEMYKGKLVHLIMISLSYSTAYPNRL